MKKILVLCSGNSCRSQMAEGYLTYYAKGNVKIFSAGLESHGVHPMAVEVMAEDSIDISHQPSKALDALSRKKFDYLITVCEEARVALPAHFKFKKKKHFDIPDPAKFRGTDEETREVFRQAREQIKKAILKFIGQELLADSTPYNYA